MWDDCCRCQTFFAHTFKGTAASKISSSREPRGFNFKNVILETFYFAHCSVQNQLVHKVLFYKILYRNINVTSITFKELDLESEKNEKYSSKIAKDEVNKKKNSSPRVGFELTITSSTIPYAVTARPQKRLMRKEPPMLYLFSLTYFWSIFGKLGGLRRSWD